MTENLVTDASVKAGVPMGRVGDVNDMGGLILFLASKVRDHSFSTLEEIYCPSVGHDMLTRFRFIFRLQAGSYVNGTVHLIDGGRLTLFPSTH